MPSEVDPGDEVKIGQLGLVGTKMNPKMNPIKLMREVKDKYNLPVAEWQQTHTLLPQMKFVRPCTQQNIHRIPFANMQETSRSRSRGNQSPADLQEVPEHGLEVDRGTLIYGEMG